MILNLLLPALILCFVESKTANVTEEELSRVQGNQTFIETTADYSSVKPGNVTSSLYKDGQSQIEDELLNNQTSAFVKEDDEDFQDQEIKFPGRRCPQDQLVNSSHGLCGKIFHMEMMSISTKNWCDLDYIIRPYNTMTVCLEMVSDYLGCYYPNPNIQDFFLKIHSHYFHNCSTEEHLLVDAPQTLVIALTLIPISFIPLLVYLVVWKSKVQE
uniref:receptor activity-modifying protein 1 n=1 Tax=Semicossyphus pulcher TaxID=241346 RepID=UPI0037E787CB